MEETDQPTQSSAFVPLLLMSLAIVAWLSFQAAQLLREQQLLTIAQASLQTQEESAAKVRSSLDAVATATARLAADGNANARVIVEELRKRGVTINPAPGSKPP